MSDSIHSQFQFFQNVQLDADGNLLVKITNLTGATGNNYYTTGATLSGTTIIFDRNDMLSAYTVDLASIAGSIANIDGGLPMDIPVILGLDGGNI